VPGVAEPLLGRLPGDATHAIARRLPAAFIQNSISTTFDLAARA
jgi:hypothetical protein